MADNILSIQNVSKSFGDLQVLEDVFLDLKAGETISIVGPSGSGKSTLLHISGLMEKPTKGSVLIEGQDMQNMSEFEKAKTRLDKLGFLFQFHYLLPDFDVLENTLIPCRLAEDDLSNRKSEAKEILDRLGLSDRLHHRPAQLSGGEQQRAALARALIRKPKMLLCDEPTGNLDPKTAELVVNLLWEEVRNSGLTTVIVTHNVVIAEKTSKIFTLAKRKLEEKREEGSHAG